MNKIFAVLGVIILLLLVIIIIPHNTVSNTAINTYLITLKNTPSGNGMYQQLININLSYPYGINSNGSNILFKDGSNNTFLYAWIQSINATNLQVWIKNYNNSILIEMLILPSFENLFSATGYLGYGREYFNANHVFTFATDFTNLNGFTTTYGSPQFVNNGVNLTDTSITSNNAYNISSYRFIWNWTTSVISTSNYNYVGFGFANGSSFNPPFYSLYGINYYLEQNKTGDELYQFTTQTNGTNTYEIYGNSQEAYYVFNNQNPYTFSNVYYNPMLLNFGVEFYQSKGTVVFHYFIVKKNITMPTFSISPIGTAPNPLYLSNSFTISNILLMDGKVKL